MEWIKEFFHPIQCIGYLGMVFAILSYQCKRNKLYFLCQATCGACFAVQLWILGSPSAAFMNILAIIRGLLFSLDRRYRKPMILILLMASFVVFTLISIFVMDEVWWIALLLLVAQSGGTLAMWTQNGKLIRYTQLFLISPIWIVNNAVYFSIGGLIGESFNILSVIVSLIRFRRVKLDES